MDVGHIVAKVELKMAFVWDKQLCLAKLHLKSHILQVYIPFRCRQRPTIHCCTWAKRNRLCGCLLYQTITAVWRRRLEKEWHQDVEFVSDTAAFKPAFKHFSFLVSGNTNEAKLMDKKINNNKKNTAGLQQHSRQQIYEKAHGKSSHRKWFEEIWGGEAAQAKTYDHIFSSMTNRFKTTFFSFPLSPETVWLTPPKTYFKGQKWGRKVCELTLYIQS